MATTPKIKYSKAKKFQSFSPEVRMKKSKGFLKLYRADLRNSHVGLAEIAKKDGIDVTNLAPRQYLMFVNHDLTQAKLFASHNTIAHMKSKTRLEVRALAGIPRAFGGHSITSGNLEGAYKKALETLINTKLGKRYDNEEGSQHGRVSQQVREAQAASN